MQNGKHDLNPITKLPTAANEPVDLPSFFSLSKLTGRILLAFSRVWTKNPIVKKRPT
jgi:hypothetical protein